MKTRQDIAQELGVEVLVGMDEIEVVPKATKIGTFGLAGCTCFVAESETKILLSHRSGLSLSHVFTEIFKLRPTRLTIFYPEGIYEKYGYKISPIEVALEYLNPSWIPYPAFRVRPFKRNIFDGSVIWDGSEIRSQFGSGWQFNDFLEEDFLGLAMKSVSVDYKTRAWLDAWVKGWPSSKENPPEDTIQ